MEMHSIHPSVNFQHMKRSEGMQGAREAALNVDIPRQIFFQVPDVSP